MNTLSELQKRIKANSEYFNRLEDPDHIVAITVDTFGVKLLSRENHVYHEVGRSIDSYFTSMNVDKLIVPPELGRGATGGGYSLLYFISNNFEFIISVIKSVPLVLKVLKRIKRTVKRRQYDKNQARYSAHKSSVSVNLNIIMKKEKANSASRNNYDMMAAMLNIMPDMSNYLATKFNYLKFNFHITSYIDGRDSAYTISLINLNITDNTIGEVYKHIDKKYISDFDSADYIFTGINNKIKCKKNIKISDNMTF